MSLEVKPEHLRYILGLMAVPLDYPMFFFSDAEIFYYLFKRIDEKATYREIKRTQNPDIEPSYFGEIVIMYSEYGFGAEERASPVEKEVIEEYNRETFLNLAAWYILPLLEAANRRCPYMSQNWTMEFLEKIGAMNRQTYTSRIGNTLDFMKKVKSKSWLTPFLDIGSQLGKNAQDSILILVGMFLEAYENEENSNEQSPQKRLPPAPININPSISEFIENIEAIDKL